MEGVKLELTPIWDYAMQVVQLRLNIILEQYVNLVMWWTVSVVLVLLVQCVILVDS